MVTFVPNVLLWSFCKADIPAVFSTEEKHLKFDEDEENAIYRVIQESITNAVRHGKAGKIWITLRRQYNEIT